MGNAPQLLPPQSTSSIIMFISLLYLLLVNCCVKWSEIIYKESLIASPAWPFIFWMITIIIILFLSAIIHPCLDIGLPPRCPQVVWCHWGEIEPLLTMLAQDGLAKCGQPGKNLLEYSAVAGNWTRAIDSEQFHWAIMTASIYRNIFCRLSGLVLTRE